MPILYSVVARGTTILAKYASCTGNFDEVTENILTKIPPQNDKLTYSQGQYLFHYICENNIIYMCTTDAVSNQRYIYMYIKKIFIVQFIGYCFTITAFISGFPKIQSIFVSCRNERKIFSCLWSRCANCSSICNEYRFCQNFSQYNGKKSNIHFKLHFAIYTYIYIYLLFRNITTNPIKKSTY